MAWESNSVRIFRERSNLSISSSGAFSFVWSASTLLRNYICDPFAAAIAKISCVSASSYLWRHLRTRGRKSRDHRLAVPLMRGSSISTVSSWSCHQQLAAISVSVYSICWPPYLSRLSFTDTPSHDGKRTDDMPGKNILIEGTRWRSWRSIQQTENGVRQRKIDPTGTVKEIVGAHVISICLL